MWAFEWNMLDNFAGGIACASALPYILCDRLRVTLVWAVNVYDDRRGIEACTVC